MKERLKGNAASLIKLGEKKLALNTRATQAEL